MGEFIGGCLLGGFVSFMLTCALLSDHMGKHGASRFEAGERTGRCIELCRPEKLVELVNGDKECLCATKRVRLQP